MDMQNGGGIRLSVGQRPTVPVSERQQLEQASQEAAKAAGKTPKTVSKVLDALMGTSFFMTAFSVPLFATNITLQGIAFEKQLYFYMWLLLALVSWTAKGVVEGELKIRKTPLDIPLIILLAIYALSAAFSVDRWHSVWGFFGDPSRGFVAVAAAVIFYYVLLSEFNAKRMRLMLWGFAASNAIVAIWTILALAGVRFLPEKLLAFAPVSLLGSISSLALYAALMIPVVMALIFHSSGEDSGKVRRYVLCTSLFALFSANLIIIWALYDFTRDMRLALLFGASMLLIYVLAKLVKPAAAWGWIAPLFFIAVLAFLMVAAPAKWLLRINLPVEVAPNAALSWDIAKKSLAENPLLGSGPATYGYAFSKFKPAEFNLNPLHSLRFYQGSSGVFESLATVGALGTAAIVLLLAAFASVAFYLLARSPEKNKFLSLGLAASTLMMVVAFFTSRIEGPLFILGGLLGTLALGALLKESGSEENFWTLSLKASPKYALALAFVFMAVSAGVVFLFVFVGKAYWADALAGKGSRQAQVSEDSSIKHLGKATALFPYEGRYYTRLAQEFMVLANGEFLKTEGERDAATIARYLKASVDLALAAKSRMPNDVQAVEVAALVYENAVFYEPQALELARSTYEGAKTLDPANPLYYVKLGQIEATEASRSEGADRTKRLELARDFYLKAIELKADYALAHYYASNAFGELKSQDKSVEHAAKAYIYERTNPAYAITASQALKKRGGEGDADAALRVLEDAVKYNDKNANLRVVLALSYESAKKKEEASQQYQKILEQLPAENEELRRQLETMVSNVRQGVDNNEYLGRLQQNSSVDTPAVAPVQEEASQVPPVNETAQQAPTLEQVSAPQP